MQAAYHRQITAQGLAGRVSAAALAHIIRANLGQDALRYQIGHDHFHYDNNSFAAGDAYVEEMRRACLQAAQAAGDMPLAWQAFGKLSHTIQDFYAHSDYISRWRAAHPQAAPEQTAPWPLADLDRAGLTSGRLYYPLEILSFIPSLQPLVLPHLPRDSHAWMNKDHPARPDFDYAFQAAAAHTRLAWDEICAQLTPAQRERLAGDL